MDYKKALGELEDYMDALCATDAPPDDPEVLELIEIADQKHSGSRYEIIKLIMESFEKNETIPLLEDSKILLAVYDRAQDDKQIVMVWQITNANGGSLNLPYIIQKRCDGSFELSMPSD